METSTTVICVSVVNLRKLGYNTLEEWLENPNHVYIGRKNRFVAATTHSIWYNPFSMRKYGRAQSLKEYRKHIELNLIGELEDLRGKVLGCWCHPKRCHGDVLVDLLHG